MKCKLVLVFVCVGLAGSLYGAGGNPFAQAGAPGLEQLIDGYRPRIKGWFDDNFKKYEFLFGYADQAFGKKTFPIIDNPTLGASFSLKDWHLACARGDKLLIREFLDTPDYAHLINESDEAGNALFWAAAGYIHADEIKDFTSTRDGFELLIQDPRIRTDLSLDAGGLLGTKAFDEWLLYYAEYEDEAKQGRLDELKKLLQTHLSDARKQSLKIINDRRDAQGLADKRQRFQRRESRYNKIALGFGFGLTAFVLYKYTKRNAALTKNSQVAATA